MLVERRSMLRGLFAIAIDSLMPLRGERLIIDLAARWNSKYCEDVDSLSQTQPENGNRT
jgi:hypothetical protein